MVDSNFVFEQGEPIEVGSHGDSDFLFHKGDPVPNTGISELVFESGVGLGGGALIDDFEDEDTTVIPSNWTGWTGPIGGTFVADGSNPLSGQFSGRLTRDTESGGSPVAERDSPTTATQFQTLVRVDDPPDQGESVRFTVRQSDGTTVMETVFEGDNDIRVRGSEQIIGTWSTGTVYEITFDSVDYANDEYVTTVRDVGLDTVVAGPESSPFNATASGVSIVILGIDFDSGDPITATFDDITVSDGA